MDHTLKQRFERVPHGDDAIEILAGLLDVYEKSSDGEIDDVYELVERYENALEQAYTRYMTFRPGHLIGATPAENRQYQNRQPNREYNRRKLEAAPCE